MSMLDDLAPFFADKIRDFVIVANQQGLNVDVQCGLRTMEEQAALYNQGRTTPGPIVTNAKPGMSWHNYGVAVDIVFKTADGKWTWDVPASQWHMLAAIGKTYGLQWGGDWVKFPDLPHFELTGGLTVEYSLQFIDDLEALWRAIEANL